MKDLIPEWAGTAADLSRLGLQLREGLTRDFYMDDADEAGSSDEILLTESQTAKQPDAMRVS